MLVAAVMLMLLPATMVVALSLMTLLALMLTSLLALITTVSPPTVVPTALVVLPVSRRVVVLELKKPELLVWLPQAMSDVLCPAARVTVLPAARRVVP